MINVNETNNLAAVYHRVYHNVFASVACFSVIY